MFRFLKKHTQNSHNPSEEKNCVYAPINGECIKLSDVDDALFAQELLGKGIAIRPDSNILCAPISGKIASITGTFHAITIVSPEGIELLIHVGINTVELNGKFFKAYVKKGQEVTKGQKLLEFDREQIAAAGFDTVTPIIVANSDTYEQVAGITGKYVTALETIIQLK